MGTCSVCGNNWSTCCPGVVALHLCPCLAKLISSVREFLGAILKRINTKSNASVHHPVLGKLKATSFNKVASCASF